MSYTSSSVCHSYLPRYTEPSSSTRISNVTDHSDIQQEASLRVEELFLRTWSQILYSTPQEKTVSIPQVIFPLQVKHGKQRLLSLLSESWRA